MKYKINQLFGYFFILFSAGGISIFKHPRNSYLILLGVSFFIFLNNRFRINSLLKLLIPWLIYVLINSLSFQTFHPYFAITGPVVIFGVWLLFSIYKTPKSLFYSLENKVFYLSRISAIFYLFHVLSWGILRSLMSSIDLNSGKSYNILFYTAHFRSFNDLIPANSGFAWEPGPFACIISIMLMVRFLKTGWKIDKRTILYSLLILSTFSSTGYLCLVVVFTYFAYVNTYLRLRFLMYPVLITFVYLIFFSTSILSEKILSQWQSAQTVFEFYRRYGSENSISIGRFEGLLLNLEDLKNNTLFGYGGHFSATTNWIYELNINSTTGLGNFLAQFGVIGFSFLIYLIIRSSKLMSKEFSFDKIGVLWILLILIITFGFNLIFTPFFFLLIILAPLFSVLKTYEKV